MMHCAPYGDMRYQRSYLLVVEFCIRTEKNNSAYLILESRH